jgi:hypothetical protein
VLEDTKQSEGIRQRFSAYNNPLGLKMKVLLFPVLLAFRKSSAFLRYSGFAILRFW